MNASFPSKLDVDCPQFGQSGSDLTALVLRSLVFYFYPRKSA